MCVCVCVYICIYVCVYIYINIYIFICFPGGTAGKEPDCQCWRRKRRGFNSWVGKNPWRRAWQPTPVFLPGESPWTETQLSMHAYIHTHTHTHTHTHVSLNDSWSPFGYEPQWKYDESYGSFSSPSSSLKTTKPHYFYVCIKVLHIIFRGSQKPQRPSMNPAQWPRDSD